MSLFRDDGIVPHTQKLGEAGRIVLRGGGGRPPRSQWKIRGGAG